MKLALLSALFLAVAPLAASADTSGATRIADLVRDSNVTVVGTVDRLTDEDEFILADGTGSVRVYVGPNFVPVDPGDAVTVRGFVDDDLRLEIYAREIVRPDGSTVKFDHRYD
ncbi:MAG: NirD/YgiW/YdeI family stress tolerance protein [Rhodobacteraceae bacterium]|jgi:uncharacterized protein YdeI (BOF family)|nr:NirD/YgiW/YdeI family stress tolerance protein [Paracoccaceae bacterium]